jgi:hypothetical protein
MHSAIQALFTPWSSKNALLSLQHVRPITITTASASAIVASSFFAIPACINITVPSPTPPHLSIFIIASHIITATISDESITMANVSIVIDALIAITSPSRRQHRITPTIAHHLHHHHHGQHQRHPRQDLEHNAITTPSQHSYHCHGRHDHRDIIVAATIINITSSPSPSLPTCLASQAPLSSPTTIIIAINIDITTDMVAITTATTQATASTPLPSTPTNHHRRIITLSVNAITTMIGPYSPYPAS